MDAHDLQPKPKRRLITSFAAGCLLLLYLALCAGGIVLGRSQWTLQNAATPTVTPTTVPHILVHAPADLDAVLQEDFSSNERNWGLYYSNGKLEVVHGKLILQTGVPNTQGVGINSRFAPTSEKYYIQADFSTDVDAAEPYGLVFGLSTSQSTYYTFEIWPVSGFRLSKYNYGKWTVLIPYTRAAINPYPQATTLSVYFDRGKMELYIDGALVSEYSDESYLRSKTIGVFIGNNEYRLLVDNFFVFDEK